MNAVSSKAHSLNEPGWFIFAASLFAVLIVILIIFLPLAVVFAHAFAGGLRQFVLAVSAPYALDALKLSLIVALFSVVVNLFFGVCAAWSLAKFRFKGRSFLLTLIDLPFAVSPVIAGLLFVLLYGLHGLLSPFLQASGFQVIFAIAGVFIVTLFVTLPFVARELITILEEQGSSQEEAALTMGANGLQMFSLVTLPNIRWGLFYGMILTNARALGEFGAVSVVSGHLRGETNTLPLHIEILYNEFHTQAAFACAALLSCLALVTIALKTLIELKRKAV